jgi:hypothetical protein
LRFLSESHFYLKAIAGYPTKSLWVRLLEKRKFDIQYRDMTSVLVLYNHLNRIGNFTNGIPHKIYTIRQIKVLHLKQYDTLVVYCINAFDWHSKYVQ